MSREVSERLPAFWSALVLPGTEVFKNLDGAQPSGVLCTILSLDLHTTTLGFQY